MQSRFTACCMLRLFADKTDIKDRVLYLDTDVLCRKDFRDFYYQNMDGKEIAGVSDYPGPRPPGARAAPPARGRGGGVK